MFMQHTLIFCLFVVALILKNLVLALVLCITAVALTLILVVLTLESLALTPSVLCTHFLTYLHKY